MMSLTLYLCRKNTFPGQMRCIFFSVSPRDREFPKTGHKMLAKWGIRLPNQFLSHNTLLQSKNQAKVAYFTKLMILIFGCPEEIRITNFTRMSQKQKAKVSRNTSILLNLPASVSSSVSSFGREKNARWTGWTDKATSECSWNHFYSEGMVIDIIIFCFVKQKIV